MHQPIPKQKTNAQILSEIRTGTQSSQEAGFLYDWMQNIDIYGEGKKIEPLPYYPVNKPFKLNIHVKSEHKISWDYRINEWLNAYKPRKLYEYRIPDKYLPVMAWWEDVMKEIEWPVRSTEQVFRTMEKVQTEPEVIHRKEFCYRVEDEYGGMYNSDCSAEHRTIIRSMSDSTMHPPPEWDNALRTAWNSLYKEGVYNEYYFGFASMEQLRRWLYRQDVLDYLHNAGFKISIYQTEDYYIGDTQMIFRKDLATLIGKAELK